MPELPEVETTRAALAPYVMQQRIKRLLIRCERLRWPIDPKLDHYLSGQIINNITRRGKYLLLHMANGTLLIHLGMSGRLCLFNKNMPAGKHDHVDIVLENGSCIRLRDPRRFGAVLWTTVNPLSHVLLARLGPEPLSKEFTTDYLWQKIQSRRLPIKSVIMDSKIVVGVGNIYANEALFHARIHPLRMAKDVSKIDCKRLVSAIRRTLKLAIAQGGTTLRDFASSNRVLEKPADGEQQQDASVHSPGAYIGVCEEASTDATPLMPIAVGFSTNSNVQAGYFQQQLQVYGRAGENCFKCQTVLTLTRIAQRATVFCTRCQN